MLIQARAKINLRLEVLGRRQDGYHELQMIMAPIDLADELTLERSDHDRIHFTCDDDNLPTGEDNLVVRAAKVILAEAGVDQGVSIHLRKRIPVAAGLGGGSSDAAAVLMGLREFFALDVAEHKLHQLALQLGADVPFFLMKQACLVRGIGEKLTPFSVPSGLALALVKPQAGLSTAEVYQALGWPLTEVRKATNLPLSFGDGDVVSAWLRNDLEAPATQRMPQIKTCKNMLLDAGAQGALMSGSGPTVFGIFPDSADAVSACERARNENFWAQPCTLA